MEIEIWKSTLDKRYLCRVVRIQRRGVKDGYAGKLTVTDTRHDSVIYEQAVGLAYGAAFGPDVDDVRQWEDLCVDVVDKEG